MKILPGHCSPLCSPVKISPWDDFLAATEQLYNSLCLSVGRSVGRSVGQSVGLSVGQTFSHDDVNRIEAKPLKVESSDLECILI